MTFGISAHKKQSLKILAPSSDFRVEIREIPPSTVHIEWYPFIDEDIDSFQLIVTNLTDSGSIQYENITGVPGTGFYARQM